MPAEPTAPEQPSQMTPLATQLQQQRDVALQAIGESQVGDMKRLEEEFAKANIENTPTIGTPPPQAPAAAPAAGAKGADKTSDKTDDTPTPVKSRIPASLLTKKADTKAIPTLDPNKPGAEAIDEALTKLLDGVEGKDATKRIQDLNSLVKEAQRRIKEEYEPARDTHQAKIKELETQLASMKESPKQHQAKLEALTKERDELDATLKKVAIERHPNFKAAYDDKIASMIEKAKGIVGAENASVIDSIFAAKPDSAAAAEAYEQLVDAVGAFKANNLLVLKNRLDELKSERSTELENWKNNTSTVEQLERSKAVEAEKARLAERDLSIRKTLADITSEQSDLYVFRKVEGDNEWNAGVDQRLAEFQQFATQELTPQHQVELAKRAASAGGAFELINKLHADYVSVVEELTKIKKATPGFGGGSPSGGSKEPENEEYGARIERLAREAGVFNR
jgi:hypothetical protein